MKKRFAQVGLGGRSQMYLNAVTKTFPEHCELVALCDRNPGRLRLRQEALRERGLEIPGYAPDDFERMITEQQVNAVIVTTQDSAHHHYLCRAMELGCDVITEKPMTTDAEKCREILDTQRRTGRNCRVTFNYRYAPPRTQLKDLLMSGVIGGVVSVDFHWLLDTRHGADYCRRWHRHKENSGGLLVHKATHHFDLVNWWLSSVPEEVFAWGKRNYYVPATAERYGLADRAERCHDCGAAARCPFFLDLAANAGLKQTYLDHEHHDGYFRDRCVFSKNIDIEDTMSVMVRYRSGAQMSYSLHSFMPWEGFVVAFNGTRGRLEHVCRESVYINGDGSTPGELELTKTHTTVFPHFRPACQVELWTGTGGHGGGDPVMLNDIFGQNPPADPYRRAADQRGGAWSIMTGIAANQSLATGIPVRIRDLIGAVDEPEYPLMPHLHTKIPDADLAAILERQGRPVPETLTALAVCG